jgi:uncharacterized protein HemX
MQAVVIGIVAILVGLGIGYFTWGAQSAQVARDVQAVRGQLTEAQKAAEREGQLATRIQDAEAKLKQAQADLQSEAEQAKKLESLLKTRTRKK